MPSGPAVGEVAEEPEPGGARRPAAVGVDEALRVQGRDQLVEVAVHVADDVQRAEAVGRAGRRLGDDCTWTVSPRLMTGRSRCGGRVPVGLVERGVLRRRLRGGPRERRLLERGIRLRLRGHGRGGRSGVVAELLAFAGTSWTYAGTRKSRSVAVRTTGP